MFDENVVFDVPKYQRAYAWGQEQVADLLSDLSRCCDARASGEKSNHFLGGIVSTKNDVSGSSREQRSIIDGQQRIASIILLVHVLREKHSVLAAKASDEGDAANEELAEKRIEKLTAQYFEYPDEVNLVPVTVPKLTLSEPDSACFRNLIALGAKQSDPERDSHKRLAEAKQLMADQLDAELEKESTLPGKLKLLANWVTVLNEDVRVIHMRTAYRAEAYRLFQVLNDRGIGLTEGDLLRAKCLELLDDKRYAAHQKSAEDHWNEVLKDAPGPTLDFLKWYHAARNGKRARQAHLFDDFIVANFPNSGAPLTSSAQANELRDLASDVRKYSGHCRKLVRGDWPFTTLDGSSTWQRDRLHLLIVQLRHTNCIPVLMAARELLSPKKFSEIVEMLERVVFRYKTICNQHATGLTTIYNKTAVDIRAKGERYSPNSLRKLCRTLIQDKAPDELFAANLAALEYNTDRSNKPLKYFLMTTEHYRQWCDDGATGSPKCKDKTRVYDFTNTTIEHIYPQNPESPDSTLEPYTNTLGNLTFLGPNDNNDAANTPYSTKRPIFQKSSVGLNRSIGENATWDVKAIEKHRDALIGYAKTIFVA